MDSQVEEKAFYALLGTVFTITFSIALGQLAAGICLLVFLYGAAQRRIKLYFPPVLLPAVVFIIPAVVLSFLGGELHGLWQRCGKLFWFLLLIPLTASLLSQEGRDRKLLVAFLSGCAVLGVKDLVYYQVMAWLHPAPDYLTALIDKGSMTDGQMLMLAVVGSSYFAAATLRAGLKVPWWGWGLLLAQVAGLLINFKRGSWFCALLLVVISLVTHLRWRAWCLALVVAVGFFMLPPVQSRLGQLHREFNVEGGGRLAMWLKIAPELVREHPLGIGYGCLSNDMMRKVYPRVEPNRNHLHSNLVQVLVETGWIGLLLYLVWMGKSFWDGIVWTLRVKGSPPVKRAGAGVVVLLLAGLLLNGLVEYNFGDTEIIFIYAFLMGLAAAGARLPKAGNLPGSL